MDQRYEAELRDQTLVHFLCTIEKGVFERRYGITDKFVRQHMRFSPNSWVFVNACESNNESLRQAFLESGAGAYAGWTQVVQDGAAYLAGEAIMRWFLFSPNSQNVISTLSEVRALLALTRIDVDAAGSRLVITEASEFGQLLPSLRRAYLANGRLVLEGEFGDTPGEVLTDQGQTLPLLAAWRSQRLECAPPTLGTTVHIRVNSRKSNSLAVPQAVSTGSFEFTAVGTLTSSTEPLYPKGSTIFARFQVQNVEVIDASYSVSSAKGGGMSRGWGRDSGNEPGSTLDIVSATSLVSYDLVNHEPTGAVHSFDFPNGVSPGSLVSGGLLVSQPEEVVQVFTWELTITPPPPPDVDL